MPKVFLNNEPTTRPLQPTQLVNPGNKDAYFQGMQHLSRGIASMGEAGMNWAMQVAKHENEAALAYEDAERLRLQGAFEEFKAANPNSPALWQKEYERLTQDYEKGRSQRAAGKVDGHRGWAPVVQEMDDERFGEWKTKSQTAVNVSVLQGQIRQNNARLMVAADEQLRAGNHEEFARIWDDIDMDPVTKAREKARKLSEGLFYEGQIELDSLSTIEEIQEYRQRLMEADYKTEKDENGVEQLVLDEDGNRVVEKYKYQEFEGGGLGYGGRQRLVSYANARIKSILKTQVSNAGAIRRGIDNNTIVVEDIQEQIDNGQVDKVLGEAFIAELKTKEQFNLQMEYNGEGAKTVAGMVDELIGVGLFRTITSLGGRLYKPEIAYEDFHLAVTLASTGDIPIKTKRDLLTKISEAYENSLIDDKDDAGRWWFWRPDRSLSEKELEARVGLHDWVQANVNDLRPRQVGMILIGGERRLREIYEENPDYPVQDAMKEIKSTIVPQSIVDPGQ